MTLHNPHIIVISLGFAIALIVFAWRAAGILQPAPKRRPNGRPQGDLEGMCPHDCYDAEPCAECDA